MKKGNPKFGKRAENLLKKSQQLSKGDSEEPQPDPVTAEDFLVQGSIDEESGDRWLGSDLSKSLRFYQKAYSSYLKSIELSTPTDDSLLDSYYNSARLLFSVYSTYFKHGDGIDVEDLTNVDEVFNARPSVAQELPNIVNAHEQAMQIARSLGKKIPFDLLFNTAVVYTELVEVEQENPDSDFNYLIDIFLKIKEILLTLMEAQVTELENFVNELTQINPVSSSVQVTHTSSEAEKQEELVSEEIVQPVDLYETVIASYKAIEALYENVTNEQHLIQVNTIILPLLETTDRLSQGLIEKFSDNSPSKNEMLANISQEQINQLVLNKTVLVGLSSDVNHVLEIWSNSELPDVAERYMIASDNIQTIIERNDIAIGQDKELFWKCLSQQSQLLKRAQEILNETYIARKKVPSGIEQGLGTLICQLSEIMIARADIELQRSSISGLEASERNRDVLLQNVKNLLKSAMNIANSNGGLRERVSEKLQRDKKKSEAVFRLCLVENKTTIDELDKIMTRRRWVKEVPGIQKLGYYNQFGVQNLHQ
ncbi:uncharacterized protein SPAPADRAFT_68513 [Spathaspora passalidarum NRRL Y-27907]|uniref:Uncharacterized protein n=1 Tax=Spathaspora passalidarum (strain NRRL Y-27907 / 11-Y1) TaxID=619300 RepID=G3AU36_SPAPN|nr:uncharacterized protein SPAPADRAFT_68513 [Spathaspora passalidarum NRRL Y-27907]EGW30411.1 hypothetical protein SPAPADRAFT_68513 [Spathaspora passalidarum NRRL Y-27907]